VEFGDALKTLEWLLSYPPLSLPSVLWNRKEREKKLMLFLLLLPSENSLHILKLKFIEKTMLGNCH
jgi:hypothetical protein